MFRNILYVVVITSFIIVIVGLFLPSAVHVERRIAIDRPPTTVFTILNSFRHFRSWSPWAQRDPEATYEFSGPPVGAGARMSWDGDPRQVGSGWQEIIESRPPSLVRLQLDIAQQGRAESYFELVPAGSGVEVTWAFDADLLEGQGFAGGLLARYFGLFFDSWIGSDYEQGLLHLKAFAESLPASDFSDLVVETIQAEPLDILYVAADNRPSSGGFAVSLAAAYQEITSFMAAHSIAMTAQPMAIIHSRDEKVIEFDAAIPVAATDVAPGGNLKAGQSPSGRAVCAIHRGPYNQMGPTYEKLQAYLAVHGLQRGPVGWEHYISNPGETPVNEIVTHICFLLGDPS